jgi:hypothetical protein
MHYGIRSLSVGDYAQARVQAQVAHEAAEAGRDRAFLWDHMLL